MSNRSLHVNTLVTYLMRGGRHGYATIRRSARTGLTKLAASYQRAVGGELPTTRAVI
jgi:hypothetical protein